MSEQWIQQMQQKMADYKRPAPEVSWEEIDRTLAANKTRQPRLLWLRRIAAAAAFLLIAGVGYWGLLRNNTEENHGDWHNDSSIAEIRVPVPMILQLLRIGIALITLYLFIYNGYLLTDFLLTPIKAVV